VTNVARYLLNTNIISHLIRNPQSSRVIKQVSKVGEHNIFTSIVVASELRFGAKKCGSQRLSNQVEAILSSIDIEAFEVPFDAIYANIRCQLENIGKPIGPNDVLIASHALALEATLVTANISEFNRVKGLVVENWL